MTIIRIIEDNLVIDFEKYRIIKINKKYKELIEKMAKLEEQKYELEIAMANINKLTFMVKQEIEKLEQEIINDAGVK
jgi:hypothetical protein